MGAFWSITCLAGLWGFVLCTTAFIITGFPASGVFNRGASLKWGAALLLSFTVWIVGMANA